MATMTADDWLDLLSGEAERLRAEGPWALTTGMEPYVPRGMIRNPKGECPLCCFARLSGAKSGYTGAWIWALGEVFDKEDAASAFPLAYAADDPRSVEPDVIATRAALMKLLKVRP